MIWIDVNWFLCQLHATLSSQLKITKFYLLTGFRVARHITVPNFIKIGQYVAGILQFFDMAAIRHIAFVWAYLDHPRRVLGGIYHCAQLNTHEKQLNKHTSNYIQLHNWRMCIFFASYDNDAFEFNTASESAFIAYKTYIHIHNCNFSPPKNGEKSSQTILWYRSLSQATSACFHSRVQGNNSVTPQIMTKPDECVICL